VVRNLAAAFSDSIKALTELLPKATNAVAPKYLVSVLPNFCADLSKSDICLEPLARALPFQVANADTTKLGGLAIMQPFSIDYC